MLFSAYPGREGTDSGNGIDIDLKAIIFVTREIGRKF